ncbi:transmembrane amino acid transporter protein-domain-containing protein [Pelagophyceae sp. CCMP2097]|nr:transmembrane amino acid transporter protein-domain-containing protein [Pelagophyceae sp. CCMP2097]
MREASSPKSPLGAMREASSPKSPTASRVADETADECAPAATVSPLVDTDAAWLILRRNSAECAYDPVLPRTEPTGSIWRGAFAVIRCAVGPAALYIPHGFYDAGITGGLVITAIAFALFVLGISRLLSCWAAADVKHQATFDALAEHLAGRWAGRCVKFCVISLQCGVVVTYFIFLGENVGVLLERALQKQVHKIWIVVAAALLEAPVVALTTDISALDRLNSFGNGAVALALGAILVSAFGELHRGGGGEVRHGFAPAASTLNFVGTAMFAFEGVTTIVVPVANAVAPKERPKLFKATTVTVLGIAAFYTIFGATCYLAYGNDVRVIVSQSLPEGSVWPGLFVRATYCSVVLVSLPLQIFPVTKMMSNSAHGGRETWRDPLKRYLLVLALAVVALSASDSLDHVVSLLGAISCVPLSLIIAPLMHLAVAKTQSGRAVDYAVIGVGALTTVITTASTVASWRSAKS